MLKLIVLATALLMGLSSIAFANVGGRSTRFYNQHTYVIDHHGGPARVAPKQMGQGNLQGVRRNWSNRMLYR
jgi:hypothetical protein